MGSRMSLGNSNRYSDSSPTRCPSMGSTLAMFLAGILGVAANLS